MNKKQEREREENLRMNPSEATVKATESSC
jgi:hypothetical protein